MCINILISVLIITVFPLLCLAEENCNNTLKILKPSEPSIFLSLDELTENIRDHRIIYIGETHDKKIHHQLQLNLINNLYRTNSNIAIGMEMFQSRIENVLDSYLRGDMDEAEFIERINYKHKWGFDFDLYKPILEFAKKHKLPVIALNIDSEVTKEVSKKGISELAAVMLNKLPSFIDFTNDNYRHFLFDIYKKHPETENKYFERFYQVQLVWDESMAENIYNFLDKNKDMQLIVITGNGHLVYDYGIPSRVYRRKNLDYVTIVQDIEEDKGISDYIIQTSK